MREVGKRKKERKKETMTHRDKKDIIDVGGK